MSWAILDSSVYIGHWERGLYKSELAAIRKASIIRHSSVVLSELRRGARAMSAQRLVQALHRVAAVIGVPTTGVWWEAGRLIRKVGDAQSWDVIKRREFQNDALIALTARRYGAMVVTANKRDFALLAAETGISVHPL